MALTMDRIKRIFIVATLLGLYSCKQNYTSPELKYEHHHSYSEFLKFLKNQIDTIDSDFEKTTYIRKKTAELTDRTFLKSNRDVQSFDKFWTTWDGERYYNIFYADSATVKCGGAAHFLNKVYNDLGFNATTYDMGVADIHTHQITLVRPSNNSLYYVQDAFYNITFEDINSKQPLPFNGLIQHLKNRNDSLINIVQADYEFQPTIDTTGIGQLRQTYPESRKILDSIGQLNRYDFAKLVMKYKNVYQCCFSIHGYPDNLLYLYLFPLEHNSQEVNAIVQQQTAVMSR